MADVALDTVALDSAAPHRVDAVVAAALSRAVLLVTGATALTATAVGLSVAGDRGRTLGLATLLVVATAAAVAALARWPGLSRRPFLLLVPAAGLLLPVLALSGGGVPFFVLTAGVAALAGVLLGAAALPVCVALTLLGFVTCAFLLRAADPAAAVAPFVLLAPMAPLLAGPGAAVAARALTRQLRLTVDLVGAAQREAAAEERARLARELHDSVAKTLRAVSLAAVALPGSVRGRPALAEQLADVVSRGADAANREARQLIHGLRLDTPDEDFGATLRRLCAAWSAESGIPVRPTLAPAEPPVAVRYELARIAHEALANVARHSGATWVGVVLAERRGRLTLTVRDDGRGFEVPSDTTALQHSGHVGIVGMTERARTVGGVVSVTSAPGEGTVVRVQVPL